MKKVSTVAAKQNSNISGQKLTIRVRSGRQGDPFPPAPCTGVKSGVNAN
jgi:hypothetical protein